MSATWTNHLPGQIRSTYFSTNYSKEIWVGYVNIDDNNEYYVDSITLYLTKGKDGATYDHDETVVSTGQNVNVYLNCEGITSNTILVSQAVGLNPTKTGQRAPDVTASGWQTCTFTFNKKLHLKKGQHRVQLIASPVVGKPTAICIRRRDSQTDKKKWEGYATFSTYSPNVTLSYKASNESGYTVGNIPAAQSMTPNVAGKVSSTKPTCTSNVKYTVTFNANGGSSTPAAQTVTPYKNFSSWTPGGYAPGGSITISANTTLTTVFGGQVVPSITLPGAGTRSGYTFGGWATSSTASTGITGNYTPTGSVTLYAVWKPVTYRITFNPNGGNTPSPSYLDRAYNAVYGTLPTCTKAGYTLKGWFTASTGGTQVTSQTKCTGATTVYAQWSANKYNVIYNANGGKANGSKSVPWVDKAQYDAQYTTSKNSYSNGNIWLTRPGYTFVGWNESADGHGTRWASKDLPSGWGSNYVTEKNDMGETIYFWTGKWTFTKEVTLYAIWEKTNRCKVYDETLRWWKVGYIWVYQESDKKWHKGIPYVFKDGSWHLGAADSNNTPVIYQHLENNVEYQKERIQKEIEACQDDIKSIEDRLIALEAKYLNGKLDQTHYLEVKNNLEKGKTEKLNYQKQLQEELKRLT